MFCSCLRLIWPLLSWQIPFEAEERQDDSMLLLVILSLVLVGALIFVSVFVACRRVGKICAGYAAMRGICPFQHF